MRWGLWLGRGWCLASENKAHVEEEEGVEQRDEKKQVALIFVSTPVFSRA